MTHPRGLPPLLALASCVAVLASACGGQVSSTAEKGPTLDSGAGGAADAGSHSDADSAVSDSSWKPDHEAETGCVGSGECKCGIAECIDASWVCPAQCDGCSPECSSSEVCVRDQFQGGPYVPVDDTGGCPTGRHPSNGQCVPDPHFACAAIPSTCVGGALDCACAGGLCLLQQSCPYTCESTQPGQVNCVCNVP